ncbi:glycosyltransferase family 2 protein [Methanosarcina sp. WWM596]|uniref:glycosyltransferase family 2 protein n=1 Tax=Methanosarcina sp. WWM596 TaxID=1434103 RepID=UPI000615C24D|nr:glycosyltransferase family 2 protein [Methanosarcina sp. WWM596]AKB18818.1 Glycosyltransferase [Methanosarcina sp. WWM596]
MCQNPLISVIIATYNRETLLPRAINSVLNQTYENFEVVVVNDGSDDNTRFFLSSISNKKVVVHNHEKNKGVIFAHNTGIKLAKGKYIALLGDDDELLPHALSNIVEEFNKHSPENVKILWFNCAYSQSGKNTGKQILSGHNVEYTDLLCQKFKGDYWVVLDRECFKEGLFDQRLLGDHGQLWLKLHKKFKGYYVPKILYLVHREHGVSITISDPIKSLEKKIITMNIFLENFGADLQNKCTRVYGSQIELLGFLQVLNGDKQNGRKNLKEGLKNNFSLLYLFILMGQYFLNEKHIQFLYYLYFRCKVLLIVNK